MPPKAKNKKEVDIATPEIDLDAEEWIQNELADKKNGLQVTYEGPAGTYKIDDWVPNVDTATTSTVDSMDPGMELSYSFGTLDGQMSFDYEGDLRKKYQKTGKWPTKFKVMCFNCNSGQSVNDVCPHKIKNRFVSFFRKG